MPFPSVFHFAGGVARFDQSPSGPPWPLQVWNATTKTWDTVGTAARGVLYEYGPQGLAFVLTAEGNVIGVTE